MVRYIDCSNIEKDLQERYEYYRKESEIDVGSNSVLVDETMQTAAMIAKYCLDQIKKAPTADVVPKSEVERLEREVKLLTENTITAKYPHCVFGSYYAVLTKSLEDYEKVIADISSAAKADVAREIFAEIAEKLEGLFDFFRQDDCIRESSAIILAISEIAELKKKYTEESK